MKRNPCRDDASYTFANDSSCVMMEFASVIMNASALFEELSDSELRRLREVLYDAVDEDRALAPQSFDRVEVLERLLGQELCRRLGVFGCRKTSSCRS
jgi:hypothetical protein